MKRFLFLFIALFFISNLYAKDFSSECAKAFQAEDYKKTAKILTEWEKSEPENPEMLIAYFNYYLNRNYDAVPTMGEMANGQYGLYNQEYFNNEDLAKGISYLDKALQNNPSRLDIHFGKCSSFLRSANYDKAVTAIIELLETSIKVDNNWLWTNDEKMVSNTKDGENNLFSGISDYCYELLNTIEENASLLEKLFTKIELLYPNNIIGINFSSRFYYLSGNSKKAIELLKNGLKINKNDYIVLGNLGYFYETDGNYEEAKKCYDRMLKMDNPQAKQYGQRGLDAIKDKM